MKNLITKTDIEIFDGCSDVELADMANELNRWQWPDSLPHEEEAVYIKNGRRMQLMELIERRVGRKLINRRWNKDRMTDVEHEEFWGSERNLLRHIGVAG